jgi:hypothetical protein
VIKFVLWVSSTNKTDCHDITEILLKVALNTINQNHPTHIDADQILMKIEQKMTGWKLCILKQQIEN